MCLACKSICTSIFQITQEVYDILLPRGYQMTCRGTIDVKGKGSMVTYFLNGKGETPLPCSSPINPIHPPNGSVIVSPTDPNDDHSELAPLHESFGEQTTEELDEDDANDYSQYLTQKRKSLCRQPNFSYRPQTSAGESSASHSSEASDSQASQALLGRANAENLANSIEESSNLMECLILGASSSTFDAFPKSQVNELKHHSMPPLGNQSHLMDSIESLEKFLKSDLTLSEFNSRHTVKAQVMAPPHTLFLHKPSTKQPRVHCINELLSQSNDALNKGFGTTLKESIKANGRNVMKISQSWYSNGHQHQPKANKAKIPNSKSCDLLL